MLKGHRVGDAYDVFLDDPRRNADELGVGTVVEEEVVTEVLLVIATEEAGVAGRGVEGEDAVADGEGSDTFAELHYGSGEFVAEEAVEGEHFGVVAAAVDLEIGAAGEGGADAQHQLAGGSDRDRHVLNAEVFLTVKNGGSHCPANGLICGWGHLFIFSSRGLDERDS